MVDFLSDRRRYSLKLLLELSLCDWAWIECVASCLGGDFVQELSKEDGKLITNNKKEHHNERHRHYFRIGRSFFCNRRDWELGLVHGKQKSKNLDKIIWEERGTGFLYHFKGGFYHARGTFLSRDHRVKTIYTNQIKTLRKNELPEVFLT